MAPGNVVEYLEGKELALAFCLSGETKGKIAVLTSTGRKESLAAKKILFAHACHLSATASREEVLEHLRMTALSRENQCESLNLEDLWELILEEGEERDWSLDELAAFLFSEGVSAVEKSVAFRALLAQRIYFWRKADSFRVRTREQVEEALTRQQVEAQREVQRTALKDWLRSVWDNGPTEAAVEHRSYIEEWATKIRDAAVWGEKSSHYGHVQRLLRDLDNKTKEPAFLFMVRLGEWTVDENLDLMTNETPLAFPAEVLQAAHALEERLPTCLNEPGREDLTDWICYSIDDSHTTEVDDALAYRRTEDGFQLAIHIADAAAFLTPDQTVMENEIRERATSIYLPDLKVRMVPEVLSDNAMSLVSGEERLAFSFIVDLDSSSQVLQARMTPSKILVTQRFDYDEVDALVVAEDPYWANFAQIAQQLKERREAKGALNLPFPRMDVRLDGSKVTLVPDERDSVAQTIVSELAILANGVAADYTAEHGLPAIYRGQKAPEPPVESRTQWLPHHLFEVRKSFSRSSQGLEPCPHSGLGLDRYIQATSPIRRYRDLIHQRQIKHHLRTGEVLYSASEMEEIMTHTSTPVSQAEKMERNRRAYFLHKYLKAQRGAELEAVVVGTTTERYVLQLTDSLREVEVPHGGGSLKAPGETVHVKLLSVYPRERVVKVSAPI